MLTQKSLSLPLGTQSPCITHSKFNTQSSASLKLSSDQKRETPSKASSMQVTTLVGALWLLFGLLFSCHFQGDTFLRFSFLHIQKRLIRLCFASCAAYTWKILTNTLGLDTLSRCSPAFPFPSAHCMENPPAKGQQSFSLEVFFLFWAHCISPKYTMATRERPSTESTTALLYCLWLRGSNYSIKLHSLLLIKYCTIFWRKCCLA